MPASAIESTQYYRPIRSNAVRARRFAVRILRHLIVITLAVPFVVPFFWMVTTSLKTDSQVFARPPVWIPHPVDFSPYVKGWTGMHFTLYLRNTMITTFVPLIGQVLSASLVAYSFARLQWRGRDILFVIVLSTMMLPAQVTLIPTFLLFKFLGFLGSFKPLIIPAFFGGGAFNIFLLRQFFTSIPQELDEAAIVDGASALRRFAQIVLPLSKPALATVVIFGFMHHWNAFLGPLIYLNDEQLYTLTLGLARFRGQYEVYWNQLMAVSTLVMLPCLVTFFFAQRQFIQGITLTGLQGV